MALLLDAGASMGARNNLGRTPLMVAAVQGATDCATMLLGRLGDGAREQLGLVDTNGNSAAHLACWFKHPSKLALLLDGGASMDARNNDGRTPLMLAAAGGATDCLTLLLEKVGHALDLDAQDDNDWTALHMAAEQGHHQVVSVLVYAGVDPTIGDSDGQTPLDIVQAGGHQECVDLLDAALVEPQRSRLLFKARALIATRRTVAATAAVLTSKGLPAVLHQGIAAMTVPSYLAGRVAQAHELPQVSIQHDNEEEEKLGAFLKYALGLEGGGGVVLEGQEPAMGMLPEVLVELLEQLVPKWDGPGAEGAATGRERLEEG